MLILFCIAFKLKQRRDKEILTHTNIEMAETDKQNQSDLQAITSMSTSSFENMENINVGAQNICITPFGSLDLLNGNGSTENGLQQIILSPINDNNLDIETNTVHVAPNVRVNAEIDDLYNDSSDEGDDKNDSDSDGSEDLYVPNIKCMTTNGPQAETVM
eukprot:UN07167